jgi:predicted Zn-dependent protease
MSGSNDSLNRGLAVTQVLLLRGEANQASISRSLWSVFREVGHLYNHAEPIVELERRIVADELPPSLADKVGPGELVRMPQDRVDELFDDAAGTFERTIEPRRLGRLVYEAIEPECDLMLLVVDQELAPPSDLRYVLWRYEAPVAVVSTAPMDPDYWGIADPEREKAIKRRARAACMNIVGRALGLRQCDNPQCFLFEDVDSVLRLDLMTALGAEHEEFTEKRSVGFARDVDDPEATQDVTVEDLGIRGWIVP